MCTIIEYNKKSQTVDLFNRHNCAQAGVSVGYTCQLSMTDNVNLS